MIEAAGICQLELRLPLPPPLSAPHSKQEVQHQQRQSVKSYSSSSSSFFAFGGGGGAAAAGFTGGKAGAKRRPHKVAHGVAANAVPAPPPPGPPDLRAAKIGGLGSGGSGAGGGGGHVRPLGQWSSRWSGGASAASNRHRHENGVGGGGARSGGTARGSRLTAQLGTPLRQRTPAALPFGLRRSGEGIVGGREAGVARPRTTGAAAVADEAVAVEPRGPRSSAQMQRGFEPAIGSVGTQHMLPMQLIDVHLQLPQWRPAALSRNRASAVINGFGHDSAAAWDRQPRPQPAPIPSPPPAASLARVQVGDAAGLTADFARLAAGRARRLHPMLDARRRRGEALVRSTYLAPAAASRRRQQVYSLTSASAPSAATSLAMGCAGMMAATFTSDIVSIWGDDPYNSSLRSRVRSAYFAQAPPSPSPTPPLPPPPPLEQLPQPQSRCVAASPASDGGFDSGASDGAGSCRTLRSPSPRPQPQPPNTAESSAAHQRRAKF